MENIANFVDMSASSSALLRTAPAADQGLLGTGVSTMSRVRKTHAVNPAGVPDAIGAGSTTGMGYVPRREEPQ